MASFKYAFSGIARLFRNEPHAKFHLVAAAVVIAAGLWFGLEVWEWVAVMFCIGGMFAAEAFNTSLEKLADRVCREYDPLIGASKDLSAGAVLLFAITSAIIGIIIFLPKLIDRLLIYF
ncbi:MAG: diacylglycerol kinase family protein [Muribaculaceae bacterium]|nr:diacylglycerol kinase family protein [Muribaculaceae bacterium]